MKSITNTNLIIKRILSVTTDDDLRLLVKKYDLPLSELQLIRREILRGRVIFKTGKIPIRKPITDNFL